MPRALSEQVVVLTGASSGVGRETALQLAEHGGTVVAAARNAEALDTLTAEVERLGGTITTVPTDVSQWEQVQALAQRAVAEYGRIDTWINCAAVSLYGTVTDLDVAEIDRVLDVIPDLLT
jgi:short-subunit dehydrogenase